MLDKVLNINEALIALNEGYILKDITNKLFKYKNKKILIKGDNLSCLLPLEEFKELYFDSKFVIFDDNEENIDLKKDEEYYSFKHK